MRRLIDWFLLSRDPNRADFIVSTLALTACCCPASITMAYFHQWSLAGAFLAPYAWCVRELWNLTLEKN